MFRKFARQKFGDHPYAIRTWLRGKLPWVLIDIGIADKVENCELVGAEHHWYNQDNLNSACYHCYVVRSGQLWKNNVHDT